MTKDDEERKRKIEELQERLLDIPPSQQLENIFKALTTCPKCNSKVNFGDPVCEVCGEELMEFGKN